MTGYGQIFEDQSSLKKEGTSEKKGARDFLYFQIRYANCDVLCFDRQFMQALSLNILSPLLLATTHVACRGLLSMSKEETWDDIPSIPRTPSLPRKTWLKYHRLRQIWFRYAQSFLQWSLCFPFPVTLLNWPAWPFIFFVRSCTNLIARHGCDNGCCDESHYPAHWSRCKTRSRKD